MLLQKTILCVGDGACGKTFLYLAYAKDEFSHCHIPTVYDFFRADVEIDGSYIELLLIDTSGTDEFHAFRRVISKNYQPDVILIGFSIGFPSSFSNVNKVWLPEIKKRYPKTPLVLVGMQNDLRDGPFHQAKLKENFRNKEIVAYEDGLTMAKKIKALHYIECSAKTKYNVDHLFEIVAKVAVSKKSKSNTNLSHFMSKVISKCKCS